MLLPGGARRRDDVGRRYRLGLHEFGNARTHENAAADIADHLGALVDKSLVQVEHAGERLRGDVEKLLEEALGVAAGYQSLAHPAADHAKAVMQAAAAELERALAALERAALDLEALALYGAFGTRQVDVRDFDRMATADTLPDAPSARCRPLAADRRPGRCQTLKPGWTTKSLLRILLARCRARVRPMR